MTARIDVAFEVEGAELAGWLYRPKAAGAHPLVIMSHGFSATRRMATDRYAETFEAAGLAVLLFDHRGFGDSGGEHRLRVDPWMQAREYCHALTFATTLEGIDHGRCALWGDSYSAGVALAVAAIDDRVSALVAQAPAFGRALPPADPDGALFRAIADEILARRGDPAEEDLADALPVVSDDQRRRPSALVPLTAYRWFIEYGGRFESGWVNDVIRVTRRNAPAWHPAVCASQVRCASLFLVSPTDEMAGASPEVARHAFDRLGGPKEWFDLEGGHFGLLWHPSEIFDRASALQARFLSEHLVGRT